MMNTSYLIAAVLIGLGAISTASCSSSTKSGSLSNGDSGADVATSSDAADGSSDAPHLPATLTAPAQPNVACSGSDTSTCTLPPSMCALYQQCDASGGVSCNAPWVVYYQNPHCVSGSCVWDENYFQCQNFQTNCVNGGCLPQGTTTATTAP